MLVFTFIVIVVSIIAVSYVFFVMPRATDGADMDLLSTDYACGGAFSKCVPKNSLRAFELAKERGYGIELCVTLFDGKVCVTDSHVPLQSVLSLLDGNVPLMIEIKSEPTAIKLSKQLCLILDGYGGAFAIESADPKILSFFKKIRPRYARGQIVSKSPEKIVSMPDNVIVRFLRRHLFINVISRPDFIVTDGALMREPAFLFATRVFYKRGFVRGVKSARQYSICKKRSLYTVFENIRPQ